MTAWTPERSKRGVVAARRHLQAAINALLDATPGGSSPSESVVYDAVFDAACELASAAKTLDAALRKDDLWVGPTGSAQ
jgi:hypothetical protein